MLYLGWLRQARSVWRYREEIRLGGTRLRMVMAGFSELLSMMVGYVCKRLRAAMQPISDSP